MPRFRVIIVQEREFIDDVEAPTSAEAGTILGDRIRAGTVEPTVSGLSDIQIIRYRPADDVPPTRETSHE